MTSRLTSDHRLASMSEEPSQSEDEQPRYLLPDGCSNISEILDPQRSRHSEESLERIDFESIRLALILGEAVRRLLPQVRAALKGRKYAPHQFLELCERTEEIVQSICTREKIAAREEFLGPIAVRIATEILGPVSARNEGASNQLDPQDDASAS